MRQHRNAYSTVTRSIPHFHYLTSMAAFNLTVENNSPLITYDPINAWSDSRSSWHSTQAQGATATIEFKGTGISVYGSRKNYGGYEVSVDTRIITSDSPTMPDATEASLLGTVAGLNNGPHTAIIMVNGSVVDIDYIEIQGLIPLERSSVWTQSIDDSDPQISYVPSTAWQLSSRRDFMGGTLHFTNDISASASLRFTGNAVAVYGTIGPDHADIQVTLDGNDVLVPGGSSRQGALSR
ncbi:hypothetical protein HGRIS_001215 [Hohenbuehelia grisea]|uniref:Uncharacterized protein n=1 Tax=Hohenbuehelia grisea TaxID=104357 RepID=A0ABR3JQU3_9AGAR